ncbi:1667_t:CDS:10, partial [Entrophospora sp. SA101]
MVPVYTISDLLAYFFIHKSVYFAFFRDTYQAWCIASFFNLLLEYLGDDGDYRITQIGTTKMPPPLCCIRFNPSKHKSFFLPSLKLAVLQYALILYLTTFISVVLQLIGVYCKENYSIYFPQLHLVIIQTISSLIANLSLLMLFESIRKELIGYQLGLKDLCINWALFIVTYQGHILALAVNLHFFANTKYLTADDISTAIQSVLVSIEFFFLSLLHMKAFSVKEYRELGERISTPVFSSLRDALNIRDAVFDFIHLLKFIFLYAVLRRPEPEKREDPQRTAVSLKPLADIISKEVSSDIGSRSRSEKDYLKKASSLSRSTTNTKKLRGINVEEKGKDDSDDDESKKHENSGAEKLNVKKKNSTYSSENRVYEVLYENQRGYSPMDIYTFQLPDPTWEWVNKEWLIDMSGDVDQEGWEYSIAFNFNRWHDKDESKTKSEIEKIWYKVKGSKLDREKLNVIDEYIKNGGEINYFSGKIEDFISLFDHHESKKLLLE